jgi:transcriptional regulator NrdR family protein
MHGTTASVPLQVEPSNETALCPVCSKVMSLTLVETRVTRKGINAAKLFECPVCGARQTTVEQRTTS